MAGGRFLTWTGIVVLVVTGEARDNGGCGGSGGGARSGRSGRGGRSGRSGRSC